MDVSKHQYGDSFRNKISLYLQENPDLRWKVRMLALHTCSSTCLATKVLGMVGAGNFGQKFQATISDSPIS